MNRSKVLSILNQVKPVGRYVSRQKIVYSYIDKQFINSIFLIFKELDRYINYNFLKTEQNDAIINFFINTIIKKEFEIVSVFCPSYKKGFCCYGYNEEVGKKTKSNIKLLKKIIQVLNSYGIKTKVVIYFSDLILENYEKLSNTNYREELTRNYQNLIDSSPPSFQIFKLSKLGSLNRDLGEKGSGKPLLDVDEKDFLTVLERNRKFYIKTLGWDEKKVKNRTIDLALSYPYIARELNIKHPNAIYFWSESAKERVLLMPNIKLPVLIPKVSK